MENYNNDDQGAGNKKSPVDWYKSKTYNQKFLIIFFGILALVLIVALVLILVDLNSDFTMNWYGFLIGVAIVLCVIAGQFAATKNGLYGDLVFDYGIFAIPLAIFGARLYFVIFDIIDGGMWSFADFWNFAGKGGLAVYGGLIGAVGGIILALFVYRRFTKKPRVKFIFCLDLAFTFIPIGQAIGRWGCYFAGCCYGIEVPLGTPHFLPFAYQPLHHTTWHLPTFFYESVFCTLLFAFLLVSYLGKRKSFNGFNFACYAIGYGLCRGILEIFRADAETLYLIPGVMPVSQFVSILAFAFGVIWIAQYIIRAKNAGKKLMIFVPRDKLNDEYFEFDKTIHAHPHVNYIDGSSLESAGENNIPVEGV